MEFSFPYLVVFNIVIYFPSYDWMKIYDGGTSNSPIIGSKLCGTNVPRQIESSSNELLIHFHYDDSDGNAFVLRELSQHFEFDAFDNINNFRLFKVLVSFEQL